VGVSHTLCTRDANVVLSFSYNQTRPCHTSRRADGKIYAVTLTENGAPAARHTYCSHESRLAGELASES